MADIKNKTTRSSPENAYTALMEKIKAMDFTYVVIVGVILGQVFIIYQLVLPVVQNTQDTYREYKNEVKEFKNTIKDYNEKRNILLENRIKELENKVASLSAQ